ncbi:MAG TPA: GAF domain-containing protein, partial [Balneolaceae bacterium]|nr:GAF domain-containing protein [Balneolaceae bacterium]
MVNDTKESLTEGLEINGHRKEDKLLEEQTRLLELIATGKPLEECLSALCSAIPYLNPGVRASVLLADEHRKTFKRPIAPELLPSFGQGLEGAPISDLCIGTCGEAVFSGEPVICKDIANDEKWSKEWRNLCLANDVLACQSTPVFDNDGNAQASFMLCFNETRTSNKWEQRLAEFGAHIISIALKREQAKGEQRMIAPRLRAQKEAFQAAADGAPLEESLGILIRIAVEEAEGDARAAFYIVDDDGSCLHPIARTSDMSKAYTRAVDGFPIGADSCSCGLAAHTGKPVLSRDVYEEPLWKPLLHLAEKGDFHGCWSFPVETVAGKIVGSFAMYYREPREATPRDRKLAGIVTQAAAIIISRHNESEERKQSEKALRRSKEKYRNLFESMDEGYCIIQVEFDENDQPVDYQVVEVNPAAKNQIGLNDMEEMEGKNPHEILPEQKEFSYKTYGNVVLTREPVRFEKYAKALDRYFNVSVYPYGPPKERKAAVIFNDITDLKRTERALRQNSERL